MNRNKHLFRTMPGGDKAFTLLEVLVAIAIIAIAMTSLFASQSRSISMATRAKFNTTASFLAQDILARYQSGQHDYVDDEGDFGEGFPGYHWQVKVERADLGDLQPDRVSKRPLQRLELTISLGDDAATTATMIYYGREPARQ